VLEVHPLGKSPVITDGDNTIIESGAIIDYIVRHYGNGELAPAPDTHAHEDYLQWMHYAEGSAMLPLMLKMYASRGCPTAASAAGRASTASWTITWAS
jgi:glutathione S-transferase